MLRRRLLPALAALSILLAAPLAASADPDDWHDGWHHGGDWHHEGGWHHEHHWNGDGDRGWHGDGWDEDRWDDEHEDWERHRFWDRDRHCWYEDSYREWDPSMYHWVPDGYGNYILIHIRL